MSCFHRKSKTCINKEQKGAIFVSQLIEENQNSVHATFAQVLPLPFALHRKGQTDVHTKKYTTHIAHELQHLQLQVTELKLAIAHSPVTVGQFTSPSLPQTNKQAARCSQTSVLFSPPYHSRNATNIPIT